MILKADFTMSNIIFKKLCIQYIIKLVFLVWYFQLRVQVRITGSLKFLFIKVLVFEKGKRFNLTKYALTSFIKKRLTAKFFSLPLRVPILRIYPS